VYNVAKSVRNRNIYTVEELFPVAIEDHELLIHKEPRQSDQDDCTDYNVSLNETLLRLEWYITTLAQKYDIKALYECYRTFEFLRVSGLLPDKKTYNFATMHLRICIEAVEEELKAKGKIVPLAVAK
jgi:hypothetical protein